MQLLETATGTLAAPRQTIDRVPAHRRYVVPLSPSCIPGCALITSFVFSVLKSSSDALVVKSPRDRLDYDPAGVMDGMPQRSILAEL